MRSELHFDYDDSMHPIDAICSACGEKKPKPGPEPQETADTIVWYSEKYIEHRTLKHSQDGRRRVPRD